MKLITCDDPKSQEMIAYASRVLDALGKYACCLCDGRWR